jgi:hypothetical protein
MSVDLEYMLTKKYFNHIITQVENLVNQGDGPLIIYLEGGHFNHAFGADDFSQNSLLDAISLGEYLISRYQKSVKLIYGILVDDLGLACSADSCSIASISEKPVAHTLPKEIEHILSSSRFIKRDRVQVFSERTTKNRAISSLKKKLKNKPECLIKKINHEDEEIYLSLPNESDIFLCRRQPHAYNIRCPGIMGHHYSDVVMEMRKRFFNASRFMIIDWSETMDRNKITQGTKVLQHVFDAYKRDGIEVTIYNLFFGDDEGLLTEHHCCSLALEEDVI